MSTQLVTIDQQAIKSRIADLQAELARAEFDLASVRPTEPAAPNAVVRFSKYNGNYSFAAIRVDPTIHDYLTTGGREVSVWYITQDGSRTSRQGHAPKSWEQLLDWVGERNWKSIEVLS